MLEYLQVIVSWMLMDFHPFSPKTILTSPHPAVTGNHLDEPSANHTRQQFDIENFSGASSIPCEKVMLENQPPNGDDIGT